MLALFRLCGQELLRLVPAVLLDIRPDYPKRHRRGHRQSRDLVRGQRGALFAKGFEHAVQKAARRALADRLREFDRVVDRRIVGHGIHIEDAIHPHFEQDGRAAVRLPRDHRAYVVIEFGISVEHAVDKARDKVAAANGIDAARQRERRICALPVHVRQDVVDRPQIAHSSALLPLMSACPSAYAAPLILLPPSGWTSSSTASPSENAR